MIHKFENHGLDDVQRLIGDYPLAWVIAPGAPAAAATLLPMVGEFDSDGHPVRLIGHMSRRRALRSLLEASPTAHFLFSGPQGYVSPEHAGRRNWGPTWNYASVRIEAEVRFDEALTASAVERLIQACEAGQTQPWMASELQDRYPAMLDAIIGFEARVTAIDATFKLAQDEDDEVLAHLLEHHPDAALRNWMRALNRDRLD